MIADQSGIRQLWLDESLIAGIRFHAKTWADLKPAFERLAAVCQDRIVGPATAIVFLGTGGPAGILDVEAAFPIREPVTGEGIVCRTLPAEQVLALRHEGPPDQIIQTVRRIFDHMLAHGLSGTLMRRQVYQDELVEVQAPIHPWPNLLAQGLEQEYGEQTRQRVMAGSEQIGLTSSLDERFEWAKGAMERLELVSDERQRFRVLSCCAHIQPPERIAHLRTVYQRSGDIDRVLAVMREDPEWYETPYREGDIVYTTKIQGDVASYERAEDRAERRMHACHCPMIRQRLDAGMPATFCYCGSGWYRQLWEGILGRPLQVELCHSLLHGDDDCQFAIHLAG